MVLPEIVQVTIDAVIFSDLLVLLSVGISLTYLTLKVPNFAHGDFASLAAYVVFTLYTMLNISPYIAAPLAFPVAGAASLALYFLVFRPLWRRGANVVTMMVASIAAEMALRSLLNIYADVLGEVYKIPTARGFIFRDVYVSFGTLSVPAVLIVATALAAGLIVSLHLFLTRTKFGIAMRASIENPDLARILGIDVEKVYAFSWFLAGGLAGLAGVFMPFRVAATPDMGWALLLRGFAATVVGGLSSIYGAMAGGLLVGITEVLGIYVLSHPPFNISTAYRPSIPFIALIVTLLVAPQGLAGVNWRGLLSRIRGGRSGRA